MKIEYALVSSDDNSTYLDFWPIVRKLWERLGIEPILLYFGDKSREQMEQEFGGLIVKYPDAGKNNPIATCWARYYHAACLDAVSIISDIDMLPFSDWYFNQQIKDIPNDKYVHLNPCIETYSRLPSCYHVAHGSVYREYLDIRENNFNQSLNRLLMNHFDNSSCYPVGGDKNWCYDEYYATLMLVGRDVVQLKRPGGESGHRIDRTNFVYDAKLLSEGYYFDSHSIRPYKENKSEIDKIINIVTNGQF